MRLVDLLQKVLSDSWSVPQGSAVCVPRGEPVELGTEILLVDEPDDGSDPEIPAGWTELMQAWHVIDLMHGLARLLEGQTGREPTVQEVCDRYMVYLENGA